MTDAIGQPPGRGGGRPRRHHGIDRHLARRLGHRREEIGLTRTEVDEMIGEPPGTVSKFERGARRLGVDHLVYLGFVLETSVAWFFEGMDDTDLNPSPLAPATLAATEIDAVLAAYYAILDETTRREILGLVHAVAG